MKEPMMEMPAPMPEQEKAPAARMMTAQEMAEFASVLMRMRDNGYGDRTINELVSELDQEIILRAGKKVSEETEEDIYNTGN